MSVLTETTLPVHDPPFVIERRWTVCAPMCAHYGPLRVERVSGGWWTTTRDMTVARLRDIVAAQPEHLRGPVFARHSVYVGPAVRP